MTPQRTVTLTDEEGNHLGQMDLVQAHSGAGALHRAFSVYVFRAGRRDVLMQKRAPTKMLWAGCWANTCCSHPHEQESPVQAGQRRLQEELGFTLPLSIAGSFVYRAEDPSGRGVEHEHVTILIGEAGSALTIEPNPEEVSEARWIAVAELLADMARHEDRYTPWFHLGLQKILS